MRGAWAAEPTTVTGVQALKKIGPEPEGHEGGARGKKMLSDKRKYRRGQAPE